MTVVVDIVDKSTLSSAGMNPTDGPLPTGHRVGSVPDNNLVFKALQGRSELYSAVD